MATSLGVKTGASQIGEVVLLNRQENVVTLADGRVYLKAGVVETTPATYPDAPTRFLKTAEFSVADQEGTPTDVAWDGSYLWVVGQAGNDVTKWSTSGTYQNVSFSVASQTTSAFGITWDGTYFWVNDLTTVYKYNSSGTYQNVSFSLSSQTTAATGIEWDGSNFWVVAQNNNVYKYNSSGVYQNVTFSVSATSNMYAQGITWDGSYLWITAYETAGLYKYNTSGVYQDEFIPFVGDTNNPSGVTWDGTNFWISSYQLDTVIKFSNAVGFKKVPTAGSHAMTSDMVYLGAEAYMRVK